MKRSVFLIMLLCGALISGVSQAQNISKEQLESFKKLPKSQQEALAKQFGVDVNMLRQSAEQPVIENPQVVTPPSPENGAEYRPVEQAVEKGAEERTSDKQETRNTTPELNLFGYDLFAGTPTTFAPATDIPVPSEYIIGPGDNINLTFYGKNNNSLVLVVDRDGKINIPDLGPIHVAGLSFQELKDLVEQEVKQRAIGLDVITSLGALRSIRIFILGEASRPGSYTVSALSTITNALFVSGGIKKSGSLRNIQLKRNGEVVTTFDLYDLLLNGDTSADTRVLPGDVIFIPPIGETVGIAGEVMRSAIFELKDETTFADVVALSGGFLPTTYLPATKVNRIDQSGQRTVIDADFSKDKTLQAPVVNGDLIRIFSILDTLENVVNLSGNVTRPGNYAFVDGLSINDLITDTKDLLPNVDLNYALIRRENPLTREIRFEQFSLRDALAGTTVPLQPRDKIIIFRNDAQRDDLIAEDMARLRSQTALGQPAEVVSIIGPVRSAGSYPFIAGMTVNDLMAAAGNLKLDADEEYGVLVRRTDERDLKVLSINVVDDAQLSTPLTPEDTLYLFSKNQDRAEALAPVMARLQSQVSKEIDDLTITITGEVRYPGVYPYSEDMSIEQLVSAAGGFTEAAYLEEAEISRFVTDKQKTAKRTVLEVALSDELTSPDQMLLPKDVLQVKRIPQWYDKQYVELQGEFRFPGRYLLREGETLVQVVERAGGMTNFAYPQAAVFLRPSLGKQQLNAIRRIEKRLEKEMAITSVTGFSTMSLTDKVEAIPDAVKLSSLVDGLAEEGLGRIALDLLAQVNGSADDIPLQNGDRLVVPRKPATVSIIGEVQQSTSHVFDSKYGLKDYIELAGGVTKFADESRIYVLRANGRIYKPKSNWFHFANVQLRPGDTIVVPAEIDLGTDLALWQQLTQIVYNSAIAITAIDRL